ncbi:phosphotransferase family protein [Rhodophyticola sp. CCM32]|uniref:phosphotransferase family protein n=1 Tax=Rhodophyticola sp. CCM32 TaxID=2916397 RepID=UPI00107F552B|nr:phosphotransferase family protein [Rhodophyticola sp. CCM32]QBX99351.1 phosphotransferase family protein [Rhodophyticola sp. CCM32]
MRAPGLDLEAVAGWMRAHVAGFQGPVQARKFELGQSNPTYLLEARSGRYVLRRKPLGKLLKSAHAVDREFRVQQALSGSDVPVARMIALCEDASVIGSDFYVMDFVAGRSFDDPRLPDLARAERAAVFEQMGRVLAAIHSVDIDAVGLSDYGPRGAYYPRQIDRWTRQYRASATTDIPQMEALITWLERTCPEEDGRACLVHGDYRLDNLLFAPDRPQVLAVLDWELSTIGHPFADLAAVIMQWQMPPGREGRGLAGVDRAAAGLPPDEDFVAAYCARMGLPGIGNFGFYVAFCFFRMAAILQGVMKRALDGTASDPEQGRKLGALVPEFARGGLRAAGMAED